MSNNLPTEPWSPFARHLADRRRKARNFVLTPYDSLPPVLFREEVKFLYDQRAELLARIESAERKRVRDIRAIKHELAELQHGFQALINQSKEAEGGVSPASLERLQEKLNEIKRRAKIS